MTTITIALPDDRLAALNRMAERSGLTSDDLVRLSIEDLLAEPEEMARQAAEYVLNKNADLYRRLA